MHIACDLNSLQVVNACLTDSTIQDAAGTLLALTVLDITQSTEKVGLVYLFTILGFVIFTFLGGILGDRLSRKLILCFSDFGRGLVVLLLVFAVKERSIIFIYATSFLLSMFASFHGPVKLSFWAEAIPRNYLGQYNSLSQLSVQSSSIIGPLIVSFFVLRNWISFGFIVDAFTFFACALVFSRIASHQNETKETIIKKDFLQGIRMILQTPNIKKYVFYDAIQMIGFGAFNATFLVLAQRDFTWSKTQYSLHLVIVALLTTVGALVGAMRRVEKINPTGKLTACALMSAFALYIAITLQSFPSSSFFVGICDALIVLTMAVARTKVQLNAKHLYPDHLSSIIAARSIILKAATLFVGLCLLVADLLSLKITLTLLIIPIALSFVPLISNRKNVLSMASSHNDF